MPVTRKDVAKHAEVAESTAAMILTGRGQRYSLHTREKVMEAAKKLHYRPNLAGRSLTMKRSFLIGVLFNATNTSCAAEFLRGVQGSLRSEKTSEVYSSVVFSHANCDEEADGLQQFLDRQVDGVIANVAVDAQGKADQCRYQAILEDGMPVVEVFGRFVSGVPAANVDEASAGRSAARQLMQFGHRRIALLVHEGYDGAWRTGNNSHVDAGQRYRGYEQALRAAGLEPIVITHAEPRGIDAREEFVAGGLAALPLLLEHPAQPTAVVCYNDWQAVGLIRAARRANVAVPGRLSIVGFGDTELSQIIEPALTTLRLPAFDIGCEAARMILELLDHRSLESVTVPCELIVRESTAGMEEIAK